MPHALTPCAFCQRPAPEPDRAELRAMAGDLSPMSLGEAVPLGRAVCYPCCTSRIIARIVREVHEAERAGRKWGRPIRTTPKAHSASR